MKDKKLLKDLIKERGMTQLFVRKKLSEKGVEISVTNFNHWCNGKSSPGMSTLYKNSVYQKIADIINAQPQQVKACFN